MDFTDDMAGATGTKSGVRRHETTLTVTYASGVHLLRAYHNPCIMQMGGMSLRPNMKSNNHESKIVHEDITSGPDPGNWLSGKRQLNFPLLSRKQSLHLLMIGHGFVAKRRARQVFLASALQQHPD